MWKRKTIFEEFIKNYLYKAEGFKNTKGNQQRGNQQDSVEWFTNARSKTFTFGPVVKSEALAVAKSLPNDQFKASTRWLDSFKKRHNIVWNRVRGKSNDKDESVVSEYKTNLLELISPYEPKHIYNADETGSSFSGITNKIAHS
jgi:hypothetical protein